MKDLGAQVKLEIVEVRVDAPTLAPVEQSAPTV